MVRQMLIEGKESRLKSLRKGYALNCKETIRLICEYLEGRLGPGVEQDIRRHLSLCKDCGLVLDAARSTLTTYFNAGVEAEETPTHKVRVA